MSRSIWTLIFFILGTTVVLATSTVTKIKSSKNTLNQSVLQQKKMNRQLNKIASDIKKAKSDNLALNKKLSSLSKEYQKNEISYKESKNTLISYDKKLTTISNAIEEKKEKYINLLAQQFSIIHAMTQSHEPSKESIIKSEMYQLYKIHNDQELKLLKEQIDKWKTEKKLIVKERISLKKKIDALTYQRAKYEKKRNEKKRILDSLASDEEAYRNKLQQTLDTQDALRSTLADLNIIHKKELQEEKRRIAAQKAAILEEERRKQAERKARELAREEARKSGKEIVYNTKAEPETTSRNVKKIGSSYKPDKVYSYRGGKTISPLPGGRLIKGFGTYVDPIYKIKIFNESITLMASSSNAKVYNVLNGKVVFAGVSSMLGKVVVVAHGDKMHTVYAGLSKIAPNLRKGSRIQKGYVIGKVSKKLIFEATKNSKHINPVKLIRI